MDAAQVVLVGVIVVLTLLLLVLGVQVFFILRDLRKTIAKANKVLDNTNIITETVSGPLASMTTLSSGIKVGSFIAKLLKSTKKTRVSREDDDYGA